jgi:hypothetical protein
MARTSVAIPAGLMAPVRASVVLLYESAVEALHLALRAHGERDGPFGEVRRQRQRLARLDALLVQLGWWDRLAPESFGGEIELSGPRDVLHDAVYGALIDAGERLAIACGEGWRSSDAGHEGVRAVAAELIALDRLLAAVRGE